MDERCFAAAAGRYDMNIFAGRKRDGLVPQLWAGGFINFKKIGHNLLQRNLHVDDNKKATNSNTELAAGNKQ